MATRKPIIVSVESKAAKATDDPERRLKFAVLQEALVTFQKGVVSPVPERRRRCLAVYHWINEDSQDWPFSFLNICNTLEMDPEYIRAGIRLSWKDAAAQRLSRGRPKPRQRRRDRRQK
jgi:hypothetical protein